MKDVTLYTSYFGNISNLPSGATLISIANKTPSWFEGISWRAWFAPEWELVKGLKDGHISNDTYKERYIAETLNRLPSQNFIESLLNDGQTYIFLCYEKPDAFCHRHILRDWVKTHYGWEIKEYMVGKQLKLF